MTEIYIIILIIILLIVNKTYKKYKIDEHNENIYNIISQIQKDNQLYKLEKNKIYINNDIDVLISTINNENIREMCKFSIDGGKRLRPIIGYSILNKNIENMNIRQVISGIELLHNASLIIDDIMDNDTYRRGKKTVAATYGNNMAQLISAELIRLFFKSVTNLLKNESKLNDKLELLLCDTLDSNFEKLISGQYYDLTKEQNDNTTKIIDQKTGSIFEMIFVSAWILTNPTNINDIDKIKTIAMNFGGMYQIYDDFTDYYDDKYNNKYNYVNIIGHNEGQSIFMQKYNLFYKLSKESNILTPELMIIVKFLKESVLHINKYIEEH